MLEFKIIKNGKEAIRLEKLYGKPQALISRDPKYDFEFTKKIKKKMNKANSKAQIVTFYKISLSDVLIYYIDLRREQCDGIESALSNDGKFLLETLGQRAKWKIK